MANKTLTQLPAAGAISQTDLLHTEQGGVDAAVTEDSIAQYAVRLSRYAPLSVAISTTYSVAITPTVQNQNIAATVAATSYTITMPAVTVAAFPMRVCVTRFGATSGILSIAGLNNYGGTIRLFNDQDCATLEVVNTTGSTYAWEVTSVISTGSLALSTTPFSSTFGDMAKGYDITTGASAFVFNLPALSSAPGKEYIITKVDSGAGAIQVTPNGSDPIGLGAGGAAYNLPSQGAALHIINAGTQWAVVSATRDSVVSITATTNFAQFAVPTTIIVNNGSAATAQISNGAAYAGLQITITELNATGVTIQTDAGGLQTAFLPKGSIRLMWDGTQWEKVGGVNCFFSVTNGSNSTWKTPWAGMYKFALCGGGGAGGGIVNSYAGGGGGGCFGYTDPVYYAAGVTLTYFSGLGATGGNGIGPTGGSASITDGTSTWSVAGGLGGASGPAGAAANYAGSSNIHLFSGSAGGTASTVSGVGGFGNSGATPAAGVASGNNGNQGCIGGGGGSGAYGPGSQKTGGNGGNGFMDIEF